MYKKSQGLSINIIIIAVIALIILVVLVAVFTGRLGIFSQGVSGISSCTSSCEGIGMNDGSPIPKDRCVVPNRVLRGSYDDVDVDTEVCCCTPPPPAS